MVRTVRTERFWLSLALSSAGRRPAADGTVGLRQDRHGPRSVSGAGPPGSGVDQPLQPGAVRQRPAR